MTRPVTVIEPGTVKLERLLPGPIERVWAYITEADKRGKWLAHGAVEPRVGGRVELQFRHADLSPQKEPCPEKYRQYENGVGFTACYPPVVRLLRTIAKEMQFDVGRHFARFNRYYSKYMKMHDYGSDWLELTKRPDTKLPHAPDQFSVPLNLYREDYYQRPKSLVTFLEDIEEPRFATPLFLDMMLDVLEAGGLFRNLGGPRSVAASPALGWETKFERLWRSHGRTVRHMAFSPAPGGAETLLAPWTDSGARGGMPT